MRDFRKINRAMAFAQMKHLDQKDDSGDSYYEAHVFPVMEAVSCVNGETDVICAAVLHDTIEDTDTTYEEIVDEFGERVADLVMEVTHEGKKDKYGYYFPRLKTADGITIKLCDRASNIARMEPWSPERRQHYIKKTKFWKDGSDKKCDECGMTELEHRDNKWIGKPGHCSGFINKANNNGGEYNG